MNIPPEKFTFPDPLTGHEVIQWTKTDAKDQHLYFTSFSVTADDRWLTFLSERDGHPNLYVLRRPDGEIRKISENTNGLLHAYVYPYGGNAGLSKASPCLDPAHNRLYWIQDNALWQADLDNPTDHSRRLCPLPENTWSAFTHISPDGKTACVPVSDERAFDPDCKGQNDQMRDTVKRFREENLKSWILLIDTDSGNCRTAAELPFWVTHVQFDPKGSGRIVFNMEGGILVRPRIWCLEPNGDTHTLYDPDKEGVEEDCHENWDPRGDAIVYHGTKDKKDYLAARSWDGTLLYRHFLDPAMDFSHATLSMDGHRLLIDLKNGILGSADPKTGEVTPLCRHDSSSCEQDCHVHPITTPDGKNVIFTSDRNGSVNVYETSLEV